VGLGNSGRFEKLFGKQMRIKIYFVTYQETQVLNETLDSFFSTCDVNKFCEICIINNHSNFFLEEKFVDKVKVIHNNGRPDFSTGHLSRNWNQAILHGFQNLKEPDCDILIHCQNDVKFFSGWLEKIISLHEKFDFIATGAGDCFCSYTVDAIKKTGIWDERYCGIGYQEADYFIRSVYHNPERTCINDYGHGRLHNNLVPKMNNHRGFDAYEKIGICHMSNWQDGQNLHHKRSGAIGHPPSMKVFERKFNKVGTSGVELAKKMSDGNQNLYSGNLPTTMLYPYFEKDIPNREKKNYVN
jgi:hypothetical protein